MRVFGIVLLVLGLLGLPFGLLSLMVIGLLGLPLGLLPGALVAIVGLLMIIFGKGKPHDSDTS